MKNKTINDLVNEIEISNSALYSKYINVIKEDQNLTRQLVSFQANKKKSTYRWYKYKEAFSADLLEYFIQKYNIINGPILDPFAGAGTTLFSCASHGLDTDGIELLPVGQHIIKSKNIFYTKFSEKIVNALYSWRHNMPWIQNTNRVSLMTYKITTNAYPKDTQDSIESYLYLATKESKEVKELLIFTLLCILEEISFTRKDGQYLRWDYRAGRNLGKNTFDKGKILNFNNAICTKLDEILLDIQDPNGLLFSTLKKGKIKLFEGSCLDILPTLTKEKYSTIITSPPYANRYDYTRTYALEHAALGISENMLIYLRQTMISCTVENRAKELLNFNTKWSKAIKICDEQKLLQNILKYLDFMKENKMLNNSGIARMIRGYFYEMACVIQELHRILQYDGRVIMVNDNVRYSGISIPVDLILSDIANQCGFHIENILILEQKKGNSSQQMGQHGRIPLRKCVYIWKKNEQ